MLNEVEIIRDECANEVRGIMVAALLKCEKVIDKAGEEASAWLDKSYFDELTDSLDLGTWIGSIKDLFYKAATEADSPNPISYEQESDWDEKRRGE